MVYSVILLRTTSNYDNQERSFVTLYSEVRGGLSKIVTASRHVENCHLCLEKQCELPISTIQFPIYTLHSTHLIIEQILRLSHHSPSMAE